MQTGFFVPGGEPVEGPLRVYPSDPDYPITERHTAYEWVMVLADRLPYAHWVADLYGPRGDLTAGTIGGMQARESAVEASEQAKAIYYALKREVDAGRLVPLREEWCIDRPGIDPPDVPDFTRSVFGLDQVLPLVRRRGDAGVLIGKLLAAVRDSAEVPAMPRDRPARKRGPEAKKRLATEATMKQQLASGNLTAKTLDTLKEESMAATYGVSRDTARKARDNVLSEYRAEQH